MNAARKTRLIQANELLIGIRFFTIRLRVARAEGREQAKCPVKGAIRGSKGQSAPFGHNVPSRYSPSSLAKDAVVRQPLNMAEVLEHSGPPPFVVHPTEAMAMNDDEFFEFCQANADLRIERNAEGDLIIMAPEGGSSSRGGSKLTQIFENWSEHDGTGQVFGPQGGFILPNGAARSPDISWVCNDRLEALTDEQWQKFLPLCPDFVLELRARSDSMRELCMKMQEYISNGARLGWLLDPEQKEVHIYQPNQEPEILDDPPQLSGDPVLPGFTLLMSKLWSAMELRRAR
jgi:Uma2 family endonuclease